MSFSLTSKKEKPWELCHISEFDFFAPLLTKANRSANPCVIFRWLRHKRSGKCFLTHCWGPDEIKVLQGGAGWLSIFLLLLNVA
jgi:hypothetical protein